MIIFDLFYDKFCQGNYYPDEIRVGRFKAESIEDLDSKIDKLNTRSKYEESHYMIHIWHYNLINDEIIKYHK